MNKIIPVIAIVFAFTLGTIFSADIATAVKPVTEVLVTNTEPIPVTGSISSDPACPAENVQHWLNVRFVPSITLQHSTEPNLSGQTSYIQLLYGGSEVYHQTNVLQKIADRLNEFEYFVDDGTVRSVEASDIGGIDVSDVTYSNICAEN